MVGTESDKQPTIERNALIHIDTPASPPRTSAFPDWGAAGDPRRSLPDHDRRVSTQIAQRQGQKAFRLQPISVYGGKCA